MENGNWKMEMGNAKWHGTYRPRYLSPLQQMTENLGSGASEKLSQLNMEINSRVSQLEELGKKGEVEEAQVLLKEVEALERERDRDRSSKTKEGSKVSIPGLLHVHKYAEALDNPWLQINVCTHAHAHAHTDTGWV